MLLPIFAVPNYLLKSKDWQFEFSVNIQPFLIVTAITYATIFRFFLRIRR